MRRLLLLVLVAQAVSAARTRQRNEGNAQQRVQAFPGFVGRVATGGPHSLPNNRAYVNTVPEVSNEAMSVETGNIEEIDKAIQNPYDFLFGFSTNEIIYSEADIQRSPGQES